MSNVPPLLGGELAVGAQQRARLLRLLEDAQGHAVVLTLYDGCVYHAHMWGVGRRG
jgi:hypothetical protein